MISLTNGVELPSMFDGLPRIQTAIVSEDTLAALYSNALGQSQRAGDEWHVVPDPSGDALIVLFDRAGLASPLPRFRIQSSWVVFAMRLQGGWVVGRTSRTIGTGDVRDTTIYDNKGDVIHQVDGGGAIAFLQTNENGSFWIGHDDEDRSEGAKLGGMSFFAADGSEAFYHDLTGPNPQGDDGMGFWCCYALNVVNGVAWAQHYESMLVTRFEADRRASSWVTENNGAVALAIKEGLVARIGRYDENRYRIAVYRLQEAPTSELVGRLEFDIEGKRPRYLHWVDGKSDSFHIVHDDKWYRLALDDILTRLSASQ